MSNPLIWVVTGLYAAVAVSLLLEGKAGMAVMFTGYAIANLGVIWANR